MNKWMTVPDADDVAEYWLNLVGNYYLTTYIDGYERHSDNDARAYNIIYVPNSTMGLDHVVPANAKQCLEADSLFEIDPKEFAFHILFNCTIEKNYNSSPWTAFVLDESN